MAQHFTASSCRGCIPDPCLPRCVFSREVQRLNPYKHGHGIPSWVWKRAFLLQRQSINSTTRRRRQPLYVFTAPAVLHWSNILTKRATYQAGYTWKQATIPRLYLTLLPDMTTIALLRSTINVPRACSLSTINISSWSTGIFACSKQTTHGKQAYWHLTCRGRFLDLLVGFMTGI